MSRYRNLGLALLAVAFGGSPVAGQDRRGGPLPDRAALGLAFIVFPQETAALQAIIDLSQIDTTVAGRIEDYAILSRGQDGQAKLQESSVYTQKPSATPRPGEIAMNGVVAHWVSSGGNTEPEAGAGISPERMEQMQDMLKPGTSAIVAVTKEPYLPSVIESLQQGDSTQVVEAEVVAPGSGKGPE